MDKSDWRFEVMSAIRLSFRENGTLDELKKKIHEIQKNCEKDQSKEDGPLCQKCKSQMVDATALMMGVRYRCPNECNRILGCEWNETEKRIRKSSHCSKES